MRIAVISDMHGNCFALDQVLKDIQNQGAERIICLGDALQGGAEPARTLARLRELNCPVVMGNADAWLLTGEETSPHEKTSQQQAEVRAWSLAQFSPDDLAFIAQFQPTIQVQLAEGQTLLCFHGSPRSFDDLIFPKTSDEEVSELLAGWDATFMTGGHTHAQQVRRVGSGGWFFNPGSVGLAYNWALSQEQMRVDPWADYALVFTDGSGFGVTFRHVPLDVSEMIRITRASGRPYAEESLAIYQR